MRTSDLTKHNRKRGWPAGAKGNQLSLCYFTLEIIVLTMKKHRNDLDFNIKRLSFVQLKQNQFQSIISKKIISIKIHFGSQSFKRLVKAFF